MATTPKAALAEVRQRQELLEAMPPALQKVAVDFAKRESVEAGGIFKLRYAMGVKIRDILKDEVAYGQNAVGQLAAYLGKTETELYAYRGVVDMFEQADVLALSERTTAAGGHISWKHLTALSQVAKATDRKKLIERVFAESLSANDLMTEIAASATPKKNSRGGGRKPAKPTTPLAGLQQIIKTSESINNRFTVWDKYVLDKLDDVGPDDVDGLTLDRLKDTYETVSGMTDKLIAMKDRLKHTMDRTEVLLKEAEAAEAAEPEPKGAVNGKPKAAAHKTRAVAAAGA